MDIPNHEIESNYHENEHTPSLNMLKIETRIMDDEEKLCNNRNYENIKNMYHTKDSCIDKPTHDSNSFIYNI